MATWQFVADMASASPSVLLDLNDGNPFWVGDGWNLSPANYSKGYTGSPLQHGSRPSNSRSENRTLTLPLQVVAADHTAAATAIQSLGLLLRSNGFLKYQPNGAANPQFFRYFANPDYAIEVTKTLTQQPKINLQIEAESFAYGPRVEVTGSPFTVSNNPAAGTNPCHFDITNVLGDVETPLLLVATGTGTGGLVSKTPHIGTRRRGTPGGYSNVIQAEDMTNGTDAADVVDATFSNGNKVRVTFVTTALTLRLSDSFPGNGTSTIEARGEYVVYCRAQKVGNATDGMTLQLRYGVSSTNHVTNDEVTMTTTTNGAIWVNLGKMPVPMYSDPVNLGYSGVATKAQIPWIGVYASRFAGGGNLDIDCLYFMPADEPTTLIAKFPSTDTTYAIDGTTENGGACYALNAALDEVAATSAPCQITGGGGFPELIPGTQVNRIHFLRQVDSLPTSADGITNTTTIRAYYWPRWREPFRP